MFIHRKLQLQLAKYFDFFQDKVIQLVWRAFIFIFFFFISLGEGGRFVTLVQARFGGKGLDLASKRGKKEASGLASPVVSLDLLDILPHPDAARVETPVLLQTCGWRLWLRRQQPR